MITRVGNQSGVARDWLSAPWIAHALRWLIVLLFVAFGPGAGLKGQAATEFDSIFTDLGPDGVVLQVNSREEPGIPVFKARLFGTSTEPGPLSLYFYQLDGGAVTLNGHPLTEDGDGDPPVQASATVRKSGQKWLWEWEGAFVVESGYDFSKRSVRVKINNSAAASLDARLGDAWLVAGGQNARRQTNPAGTVNPPGFSFSPPDPVHAKATPVVSYVRQPTPPGRLPSGSPALGARIAKEFAYQLKRPQMAVTATWPRRTPQEWSEATPSTLMPLTGRDGQYSRGLGVRGVIWWVGEWAAENDPLLDRLPGEEVSPMGARQAFLTWQARLRQEIERAMTHLGGLLTFGENPPKGNLLERPEVAKLTFLVVQAQGVWRQPKAFDQFKFSPPPWSSWELLRAAQSEVVGRWRGLREVTFADQNPPVSERIGYRAFLVPSLPGKDQPALTKARWQWDRDEQEDNDRYRALAVRLRDAADAAIHWDTAKAAPNVARVDWKTSQSDVTITLPGATKLAARLSGELTLEYLEEGATNWKSIDESQQPWPASLKLGGPSVKVIGVRYSPGDRGGPLRTLQDADGNPAGLLPAFTSYRDMVTPP